MNIFVGNLAFSATDQALRQLFESYGAVDTVNIITDRDTGRSKGFGFVEMPESAGSQSRHPGPQRHRARRPCPDGQRSQAAGTASRAKPVPLVSQQGRELQAGRRYRLPSGCEQRPSCWGGRCCVCTAYLSRSLTHVATTIPCPALGREAAARYRLLSACCAATLAARCQRRRHSPYILKVCRPASTWLKSFTSPSCLGILCTKRSDECSGYRHAQAPGLPLGKRSWWAWFPVEHRRAGASPLYAGIAGECLAASTCAPHLSQGHYCRWAFASPPFPAIPLESRSQRPDAHRWRDALSCPWP